MRDRLIAQIRGGVTVEERTETLIRGLLEGAIPSAHAGPIEYARWSNKVTADTEAYAQAVAGMAGGTMNREMAGHGETIPVSIAGRAG